MAGNGFSIFDGFQTLIRPTIHHTEI